MRSTRVKRTGQIHGSKAQRDLGQDRNRHSCRSRRRRHCGLGRPDRLVGPLPVRILKRLSGSLPKRSARWHLQARSPAIWGDDKARTVALAPPLRPMTALTRRAQARRCSGGYLLTRSGVRMTHTTWSGVATIDLEKSHNRATALALLAGITMVSPRAHFFSSSDALVSFSRKAAEAARQ